MPTRIIFASQGRENRPMALNVQQSPDDVVSSISQAAGQPFLLSRVSNGAPVYVNPTMVAYFEEVTAVCGDAPRM